MLSIDEISDRMEIQELLTRYTYALDTQDWRTWESLFVPGASIDYTETGSIVGTPGEVRAWLEAAMPMFRTYQHMIAGTIIDFDPDRSGADVKTMCHNPLVLPGDGGDDHVFFCGIWYHDHVVRTADGWRFDKRYERLCYFFNRPNRSGAPSP